MPFVIPLTYFLLLPHSSAFLNAITPTIFDDAFSPPPALSALPYTPLALDDEEGEEEGTHAPGPNKMVHLTINDKIRLVKPLLLKYMLPLCTYESLLTLSNPNLTVDVCCSCRVPRTSWLMIFEKCHTDRQNVV